MPGRSRDDIMLQAYGPQRGVVGVTPDTIDPMRRVRPFRSKTAPVEEPPLPAPGLPITGLVFFNIILFGVQIVGSIWAISAEITKPTILTEMRYENTTLELQTCAYEKSRNCTNETSICRDSSVLDSITNLDRVLVDENMMPRLDNLQIRIFPYDGAALTQGILIAIAIVTAIFHVVYALTFLRVQKEPRVFEWIKTQGGLPSRWIEYSLTSSLMSVFISNNAGVYDVNAVIAIALSQYALMYFGLMIEKSLATGHVDRALQILYIPGTALFVGFALPTLRQLWTDIAILSCKNPNENAFTCEKSCFGEEIPIPLFIVVLLLLFATFPLVTLQKIYYISGWATRGDTWSGILRRFLFVDETQGVTLPVFWLINAVSQVFLYLSFVLLWGWLRAVRRIVADVLWPVLPTATLAERPVPPTSERLTNGIIIGEYLYATLSVVSKMTLLIFFITSFKDQNW